MHRPQMSFLGHDGTIKYNNAFPQIGTDSLNISTQYPGSDLTKTVERMRKVFSVCHVQVTLLHTHVRDGDNSTGFMS